MQKEHNAAVLTEINNKTASMTVNPGSGNTWNAEIKYKIYNSVVNTSASINAFGSGTYPDTAINKTRLDEQSEDPIDPHGSTSFTQVFPYQDAAFPTPVIWSETVVGGRTREERTKPSRRSTRWRED